VSTADHRLPLLHLQESSKDWILEHEIDAKITPALFEMK
jgi:hypothetical protein